MENLFIDRKQGNVPKVEFDAETGNCKISGDCYPEDGIFFFENLSNWLNQYIEQVEGPILFTISLKYFNTSSSRGIFIILGILKKYMNAGGDAELIWHYDLEDEYMLEEITGYGEEAEMPITKVPYEF